MLFLINYLFLGLDIVYLQVCSVASFVESNPQFLDSLSLEELFIYDGNDDGVYFCPFAITSHYKFFLLQFKRFVIENAFILNGENYGEFIF